MENKLSNLEGIRGIAALVVLLGHFVLGFAPQRHGLIPGAIKGGNFMETPMFASINGTASVTLFFVLSGFVLSYSYWSSNKSMTKAVIKRYPRLLLLPAISTLVSFLLYRLNLYYYDKAALVTNSDWMAKFGYAGRLPEPSYLMDGLLQGSFLTFFRGDAWLNSSLWTMHYEFIGSLIVFGFTAVALHVNKPRSLLLLAIPVLFLTYFINNTLLYSAFIMGLLLSFLFSKTSLLSHKPGFLIQVFLMVFCVYAFGFLEPATGWYGYLSALDVSKQYVLRIILHILASIALIYLVFVNHLLRKMFSSGSFRFLGRISFSMYVIHIPILFSFSAYLFLVFLDKYGYRVSFFSTLLLTLIFVGGVSYLLSLLDDRWRKRIDQFTNTMNL
jgi:peptidoglycan/LPS O-acetylase OafA/YrhL